MNFQKASEADFCTIQKFYWDVIDNIHKNNTENKNLGWEKGIVCDNSEVLTPHALAVNPDFQGKGIGKIVVENILDVAKMENKKAVRLDVLGECKTAERLYTSCGFHFIEAKNMYFIIEFVLTVGIFCIFRREIKHGE